MPTGATTGAGIVLILTSLLSLILVLHHPALREHHNVGDFAALVQPLARAGRIVHGSLIALLGIQVVGFHVLSIRLGFHRVAVVAGFMAFTVGVVIMVIPALLDGFVTADLAALCLAQAGGCVPDTGAFQLIGVMIQVFTKLALIFLSMGTLGWSVALLARSGRLDRGVGVAGLICGVVPIVALSSSDITLTAANLGTVFASQVVWTLLAGVLTLRGVETV